MRTEGGLGLGGVRIVLQELSNGKSFPAVTTGDGVFRFLHLKPGRYQVKATREGFQPFAQGDIELSAGDVFAIEFKLKAIPTGREGVREVPRDPALGPKPVGPPPEVAPSSPYRTLPQEPPPQTAGEPRPLEPLPSDDKVFNVMPNRWAYDFPDYRRYDQKGEYPYTKGHWYDPFNKNKLKGDYPIIGNETFLDLSFISDTFVDGRRIPVPSGLGSANPGSAAVLRQIRPVLPEPELYIFFRPVSRRHLVQTGGLANQNHARNKCELPGHAGKRNRQRRRAQGRHAAGQPCRPAGGFRRGQAGGSQQRL